MKDIGDPSDKLVFFVAESTPNIKCQEMPQKYAVLEESANVERIYQNKSSDCSVE